MAANDSPVIVQANRDVNTDPCRFIPFTKVAFAAAARMHAVQHAAPCQSNHSSRNNRHRTIARTLNVRFVQSEIGQSEGRDLAFFGEPCQSEAAQRTRTHFAPVLVGGDCIHISAAGESSTEKLSDVRIHERTAGL